VVREPQVDDLLLDRRRRAQGVVLGAGPAIHQSGLAVTLVGATPVVVALERDPEVAAGPGHVAAVLGVLEHRELTLDVTLLLSHPHDLSLDEEHVLYRQGKSGISELQLRGSPRKNSFVSRYPRPVHQLMRGGVNCPVLILSVGCWRWMKPPLLGALSAG
jgi:hypothetical protein